MSWRTKTRKTAAPSVQQRLLTFTQFPLICHGTWNILHVSVPEVLLYMCDNYVMSFFNLKQHEYCKYKRHESITIYIYRHPHHDYTRPRRMDLTKPVTVVPMLVFCSVWLINQITRKEIPMWKKLKTRRVLNILCMPLHDHCLSSSRFLDIHHHRFADLKFHRFTSI